MDEPEWRSWHKGEKDYYAAVGFLCNQWNIVEWFFYRLATDMLHLGREKHDVLFRHFGIVAIAQFLNEYAADHVKSEDTRQQLKFVTEFVDRCRINRNSIVHGIAHYRSEAEFEISSVADQRRPKGRKFPVKLADVQQCCNDCEWAGMLVIRMQFLVGKGGLKTAKSAFGASWREVLHAKPSLPKALVAVNPQTPPKPQPLPRPSRASRRKAATDRKN
jgi:hypothetical protein